MSFCTKCGNKLDEGSRFCPVCGTPVNADIINQQHGQYQAYTNISQPNPDLVKLKKCITEMLRAVVNIFAKPVSTITNVGENIETGTAFMIAGIFAVVYGLINMWIIKIFEHSVNKALGKVDVLGILPDSSSYKIPYGKIFLTSFLEFALLIFIVFIINYIIAGYFMRVTYNPKALFRVTACAFIPIIFFKILLALFAYISIPIGCIIYLAGIVFTLFLLYKGIDSVLHINEDKAIYLILASVMIAYIIFILINYYSVKGFFTGIIKDNF